MTGVLLGTVIAGETLPTRQICGLAMVFLGVLLGQPVAHRLVTILQAGRAARSTPDPHTPHSTPCRDESRTAALWAARSGPSLAHHSEAD
jgi:probable blue pigment (indigoidine) exporter